MQRILLLASSAILLSGCSLLSNAPYSDADFQAHPQSSSYSHSNCVTSNCVPGSTYTVGHMPEHYGQEHHGHQNNHQSSYVAEYGHSPYSYDAPQKPDVHAYGSQVQNHAAHASHQGQYGGYQAAPQLRGAYGASSRQAYKYGNLGAVAYDIGSDIFGLQGRLGYQSARFLGAEVEGSIGLVSEKDTVGALELEAGVDYSVGAFVRGVVPLGERINVFARGGYHATKIDGSLSDGTTSISGSDTVDGFAYGAGAEYALNRRDSLRLDYTRYDVGPGETESVSFAYARKF